MKKRGQYETRTPVSRKPKNIVHAIYMVEISRKLSIKLRWRSFSRKDMIVGVVAAKEAFQDSSPAHGSRNAAVRVGALAKKVAFVYMNNEANVGRGAGYVAGSIRHGGHAMTFFDTLYTPVEQVADEINESDFDVLMISSMTMIFPQAVKLCRLVKESSDLPILVGGIHPTLEKEKILDLYPEIDFICIGEGETMVLDFLDKFEDGAYADIPNLIYRDGNKIRSNPIAPATDLATLAPFPWDCFKEEEIVQPSMGFAYVTASRGCPYSCTYCCNVIYLKTYKKSYLRTRPVDDVIEELLFLKEKYDPWLYYFADEMILFDLNYVRELFTEFKKRVGGRFGLQGRVEYLDDETVEFLAHAGCRYVAMGAESGDEEFCQNVLKRKISNAQLDAAVKRCQRYGIFVTTFNMIGYPVENDDFLTLQTIRLNMRMKPNYVQLSVFYPFPGTVLAEKAIKEDLVDYERIETITDYFSESVIKGKGYVTELREELSELFNPAPFPNVQEMQAIEDKRSLLRYKIALRRFVRNLRQYPLFVTTARRIPGARLMARKLSV